MWFYCNAEFLQLHTCKFKEHFYTSNLKIIGARNPPSLERMSIPADATTQCKFLSSRGMFDMQRALLSFQLFSFWTCNIKKMTLNIDNDNHAYDDDNDDYNDDDNGGGSGCSSSSSSSNVTVATTRSKLNIKSHVDFVFWLFLSSLHILQYETLQSNTTKWRTQSYTSNLTGWLKTVVCVNHVFRHGSIINHPTRFNEQLLLCNRYHVPYFCHV